MKVHKKISATSVFFVASFLFVSQIQTAHAWSLWGDGLPSNKEYPQFREVRNSLKEVDLSSKKATLEKCQKDILSELPDAIVGADKHLAELDGKLKNAYIHVSAMSEINLIAERVSNEWGGLLINGGRPYRELHSAETLREECEYQADAVKTFNIEIRKPVVAILSTAISNTDACIIKLTQFKSITEKYKESVEGGRLASQLSDQIEAIDEAVKKLGETKARIKTMEFLLMDRYAKSMREKLNDNSASIKSLKTGQTKCAAFTKAISESESKSLPVGASKDSVSPAIRIN